MFYLSYIYTLVCLVLLDSIWLMFVAKNFYLKRLNFLFKEKADIFPIVIFYIIYTFGIYFLILKPVLVSNSSFSEVFLKLFVFGVCAYCTYDLVNQATITNWPISVTILDIIWGAFTTSVSGLIAFYLSR